MKRTILSFVLGCSLLTVTASAKKWAGTISDEKCGVAHADASEKSMKCVAGCVKGGKAAVFVSDGKVYKFSPDSAVKIKDHLGHKVTIDGKMKGDVITVKSVTMGS